MHTINTLTDTLPSGLKTVREICAALTLDEARLQGLADAGICPHWRIDGGEPLFQVSEIKRWVAQNLLARYEGTTLPIVVRPCLPPAPPSTLPPESLSTIPNLKEIPITTSMLTGVYVLCSGASIVYVGQSVNPSARIANHPLDAWQVDRCFLVPAPREALDEVEAALIRLLNPTKNGRHKSGKFVTSRGQKDDDWQVLQKHVGLFPSEAATVDANAAASR